MEGNEGGCESNTSAINALLDFTGTFSEYSNKTFEKSEAKLVSGGDVKQNADEEVKNMSKMLSNLSLKKSPQSDTVDDIQQQSTDPNDLKHSLISSSRVTSIEIDSPRENYESDTNFNYTSDFSSVNSIKSKGELSAWEKWFVMKQAEIRRKAEMERKKSMEKLKEMQRQEMSKRKMNEASRKQWLERKKIEMQMEQEIKGKKGERIQQGSHTYTFENWILRKYQQKKVELLRRDYMKKKEEEEKIKKSKQSEESVKRWMTKAKQKPLTPRISYAYCGGSTISFYDSTRPPSPTFVNPIPWQDPCSSH